MGFMAATLEWLLSDIYPHDATSVGAIICVEELSSFSALPWLQT